MSAEPTQKAGSPTSTPRAGANGKPANLAARSNGKPANPAADSAYNEKVGAGGIPYKWLVVITVVFGIFMSILDTTSVNVALPKLQVPGVVGQTVAPNVPIALETDLKGVNVTAYIDEGSLIKGCTRSPE